MTPAQVESLTFFHAGETFLNGRPIDWSAINYTTMFWMDQLRHRLDSAITLIRGAHPNRPEAVDACCPDLALSRVFMELCATPKISFGLYSGNSFHVDTRQYQYSPARWLAVKESEMGLLTDRKMSGLITSRKDGWIYLAWRDVRGFEALQMVVEAAEKKFA
jgi:hypothetical protein